MPAHVERSELPGIGVRHDIVTDRGRRLSVLSLRDGGRELALADEDDPDRAGETITLTDDEAIALSEVLGGSLILTQLAGLREQAAGLSIEQIPLRADSPFVGRPLGDTKARTRTRCSIVAILRENGVLPAPGPADLLRSGDALVAVGTRDGLDHLVRIISGS
jgi:TrkA domain protein